MARSYKPLRPRRRRSAASKHPGVAKRIFSRLYPLPTVPAIYFWTEWQARVEVYKLKGGKHLYVCPPGKNRHPVRISPAIAGDFILSAP